MFGIDFAPGRTPLNKYVISDTKMELVNPWKWPGKNIAVA